MRSVETARKAFLFWALTWATLVPSLQAQQAQNHGKYSLREIRRGPLFQILTEKIRHSTSLLKEMERKQRSKRFWHYPNYEKKREQILVYLQEVRRARDSLLAMRNERAWLEKHASSKTPVQQMILEELRSYVQASDESLVFYASAESPARHALPDGAIGFTFPVMPGESFRENAIVILEPRTASTEAKGQFSSELDQIYTHAHEIVHQNHPMQKHHKTLKKIPVGKSERFAFFHLLEEGYTHRQTAQATRQLISRIPQRTTPLLSQLDELRQQTFAEEGWEVLNPAYYLDTLSSDFPYEQQARLLEKVFSDHGHGEALSAFVERGEIEPLLQRLGRKRPCHSLAVLLSRDNKNPTTG